MAGDLNIQPPQTYSRLFRPWDFNKVSGSSEVNSINAKSSSMSPIVKVECCTPPAASTPSVNTVKREANNSFYCNSPNDSDRECGSSSSRSSSSSSSSNSSKSSFDESMFITSYCAPQNPPHAMNVSLEQNTNPDFLLTQARFFNNIEHTQHQKNLFYTNHIANPAHGFGLDPFALGLMEQEYSRVMAEEAHLKALNARKQRPKKFKCPHCDVAFSNNGQLKGHIRIHTGERPFKCDVETCGKTFTRNEELTRHKRIHTGLRPYACTVCGKKFGRRDHLKKHMKTHMQQQHPMGAAIYVPVYPYLYGY